MTLEQIKNLDIPAQIEAMNALWSSIAASGTDLPVSAREKQILDEAIADFDPAKTKPWADVKASLKSRRA